VTAPKKRQKRDVEILTPAEVERLMRQCNATAPTGIRNRALITVLYRGALRIAEALALRPIDVNPAEGTIRVLHGKNDVARTPWIDDGAMTHVLRWMDTRRTLRLGPPSGPLFCTMKGAPMKPQYVRVMLHRIADPEHADIGHRVHPHAFRNSWARDRAMDGVPMPIIQRQLGHQNLATTDVYLRGIAPADVVATLREMVPRWEPS
jgi:integrase/recombinase XerD